MISAILFPNMYPDRPTSLPLAILAVEPDSKCHWEQCEAPATVGAICLWSAPQLMGGRELVELQVVCEEHHAWLRDEVDRVQVIGTIAVPS